LFAIAYLDGEKRGSFTRELAQYARKCAVPVTTLVCCGIASHFLFLNKQYGNYASYYQKIGIGFLKIETVSFYWYVPAILSMVAILLVKLRRNLSSRYVATGFFLTFCAIGNSIYFFGRSHEHNILNIAVVLLFLFFLLLDLVFYCMNEEKDGAVSISFMRKNGVVFVAALTITVMIVSYSGHILRKVSRQIVQAQRYQFIIPYTYNLSGEHVAYMNALRSITNYSSKVYFIDEFDFLYYYYEGYKPVGFCSPFMTWIFKNDQKEFLQNLLDNGYYLVASGRLKYVLDDLRYDTYRPVVSPYLTSQNIVVSRQIGHGDKP
jgi:hypothetical protein